MTPADLKAAREYAEAMRVGAEELKARLSEDDERGIHDCAALLNRMADEVERLERDAARYRWLRNQHWSDSTICVVKHPKSNVKLGAFCPSGELLDAAIDAAISAGAKHG